MVDPGVVVDHVRRMAAAGADEIMLADTIGVGVPAQVRRLLPRRARRRRPARRSACTCTTPATPATRTPTPGLEHGATLLDASSAASAAARSRRARPATSPPRTCVYLLEGEGVDTGADLDALIGVAEWLAGVLGRELPGLLHRAGGFP